MLLIYYTLESIFKRNYKNKNEEFKKGFLECLHYLDIAMKKNPQFNAHIRVQELEKEKLEIQKIIKEKDLTINKLNKRIQERSLSSNPPTKWFRTYTVRISEPVVTTFDIVTNMQYETFLNMSTNFGARFSWTTEDECKAQMLQYINSKSAQGFKAYKDEKTALKDNVNLRK